MQPPDNLRSGLRFTPSTFDSCPLLLLLEEIAVDAVRAIEAFFADAEATVDYKPPRHSPPREREVETDVRTTTREVPQRRPETRALHAAAKAECGGRGGEYAGEYTWRCASKRAGEYGRVDVSVGAETRRRELFA